MRTAPAWLSLYAMRRSPAAGTWAVEVDGVLSWFDTGAGEWTLYGQQVWARPDWADLDGDGAEELTVTRSAGHGTGVSLTALHVLEPSGEGRYELSASFSLGDTERAQANAILAGLGLEGLSCGDLCDFPDPFTVELGVCDTAAGPPELRGYPHLYPDPTTGRTLR